MRRRRHSFLLVWTALTGILVLGSALGVLALSGGPVPGAPLALASTPAHDVYGARASATAAPPTSRLPRDAPAAALTLTDPGVTPGAISLSWTNPGSLFFQQYAVDESTAGSGGPWSQVGVVTAAATTQFAISGLSPGGSYWWEIVETYGLVTSTMTSNVLAVVQPAAAVLTASGVTSTSATLTWTNNATYGGLIAFANYQVFTVINGSAPTAGPLITTESTMVTVENGLTPGSSYTFYVVTSDCLADCGGATPTLSATQSNSVSVGTVYTLSASVSAERSTVDVGELEALICTASGGVPGYTFTWDYGNGTYVPGNESTSTRFVTSGPVTVSCRVTDSASSHATGSTGITVEPALTITAVTNRTSADEGEVVGFTCFVAGGFPPALPGWNFGDTTTSTVGNLSHTYSVTGSVVATCSATDSAGVEAAGSVPLTLSGPLSASATVSSPAAAPGTSLTFTAEPSNGSGSYPGLRWTFSNGATASGKSVTEAFESPGTATATLSVTDSNGGTGVCHVSVTVSPISVDLTADPSSATRGDAVGFSAVASGGAGGPYNFTWEFGDGARAYGASTSHAYSATGGFAPTLVVTDALGAQKTTNLTEISVAAPPPLFGSAFGLVLLGVAAVVAALVGLLAHRRRREEESELHQRVAGWVPPTSPSGTVTGMKICPFCRAANPPIRRSCSHCGKPLPRTPSR
jgi:hypothetical protein